MISKDHKRKRNIQIGLGIFIVFIMVFSMFGMMARNQGEPGLTYNDYKFSVNQEQRLFLLKIDDTVYDFYRFPTDIDTLSFNNEVVPMMQQANIIIYTLDPNKNSLTYIEQARFDLARLVDKNSVLAVTENISEYSDFPVYTCADSTPAVQVVYFNLSNNLSIENNNGCVVVNGNESEFLILKDRLLYGYLGVMNGKESKKEN